MCFARALEKPLLTGMLKQAPEDFRVVERLGFEPRGNGEHVYLYVRKTGANTAWVAGEIARLAGVRVSDVGYAGRKDRHAVTEQWFSCHLPGRMEPVWRRLEPDGIEVLKRRRHSRKLRTGTHEANCFRIVVRGLDAKGGLDEALADLARRVDAIDRDGFPNYFGEQRFGNEGRNLNFANELFEGRTFSGSKQGLYISAARSYLFNRELSRRVAGGDWRDGDGWLWGASRTTMPVTADPSFAGWCRGLERLGVKAMRRPLRAVPENLRFEMDGTSLVLSFELRPGSYATVLLRELVNAQDRHTSTEHTRTTTGEALGQTA